MKSSICGIQHTCINFFVVFLIITKIECWPLFKQDLNNCTTNAKVYEKIITVAKGLNVTQWSPKQFPIAICCLRGQRAQHWAGRVLARAAGHRMAGHTSRTHLMAPRTHMHCWHGSPGDGQLDPSS